VCIATAGIIFTGVADLKISIASIGALKTGLRVIPGALPFNVSF